MSLQMDVAMAKERTEEIAFGREKVKFKRLERANNAQSFS